MINRTIELSASAFRRQARRVIDNTLTQESIDRAYDHYMMVLNDLYTIEAITWDEKSSLGEYLMAVYTCHIADMYDEEVTE